MRLELLGWLYLAAPGAVLIAGLWLWRPRFLSGLVPRQRHRAVPWTIFEILCVFFFYELFFTYMSLIVLEKSGWFRWYYGSEFPALPTSETLSDVQKLAWLRRIFWAKMLAFPFQMGYILTLLHQISDTRPYQLGLGCDRPLKNSVVGFLAWFVATPIILVFNWKINLIHGFWHDQSKEDKHPLEQLMRSNPAIAEWVLVIVIAMVVAPVLEELLFRGVLQPWLTQRPWGGDLAIVAAFGIALLKKIDLIQSALRSGWIQQGVLVGLEGFSPALFVLAMLPGYLYIEGLLWRWLPCPHVARAIYGTSLLFAAYHSSDWPAPIALFPLAMILGIIAYRTQSLIGPIVLHALFNGTSCVALVLNALEKNASITRP